MKDFSTKYTVRTDIAAEAREYWCETGGGEPDGLEFSSKTVQGFKVDTLSVTNKSGEKKTGKPMGRYVTVDIGKIWMSDSEGFDNAMKVCADEIRSFLPESGSCLLAALGNPAIIAYCIGPFTAKNFIVTRHIKEQDPKLFDSFGLRETACIAPDVLGNTGIEAAEIIKGAIGRAKPSFVIAVDALASRKLDRLSTTVQICDTGISPGSGINNSRKALDANNLGVPVIAIGVPTVVEASTLAWDIIENVSKESGAQYEELQKELSENPGGFFVTPKEADHIVKDTAKLVGYAINAALHEDIDKAEIDEFLS